MSNSTKRDLKKVKSAIMLALLLLPGILIALPAVSAFHVSAYTGSSPATTLSGQTAKIDDPIVASIGTATTVTRTISIFNPAGQPGISQITISVPTTSSTSAPSGSIPTTGGVTACASTACPITASGNGPWALLYEAGSNPGTSVILPGGAAISITITLHPETSTTTTSAADTPILGVAMSDAVGDSAVLPNIQMYYTTATAATVGTPSVAQQTAGSIFTFTGTASQTGLLLYATVKTGTAADTTVTPSNFTTSNSATTINVNDTNAESLTMQVGGPALNALSGTANAANGYLTNTSVSAVTIVAGTASQLSITVGGVDNTGIYNVTSDTWTGATSVGPAGCSSACPIGSSHITVGATDQFGNTATVTGVSVTIGVNTVSGAGFSTANAYAGSYPYTTVTPGLTTSLSSFSLTTNPMAIPDNFFYGVDYGATAQITATASGASLASGISAMIVTYALTSQLASITGPTSNPTAGASYTLTAKGTSTLASPAQANLPVWFFNSSAYSTMTAKAVMALTTVSSGTESASVTLIAPTSVSAASSSTTFTAEQVVFSPATGAFTGTGSPLTNSTAVGPTSTIASQPGTIAKLLVQAYLTNPAGKSYPFSSTTYPVSTVVVSTGTMYIDVVATDQYGNSVPVTGVTQVGLSASAGSLSVTTVLTIPNGGIDLAAAASQGSSTTVAYTPPSSGTATITANAAGLSGSDTITVVSATPLLNIPNPPTTVTAGVPTVFTGTANATQGIAGDVISSVQYSVNGGSVTKIALNKANASWTFSLSLSATSSNAVNITAVDSQTPGNVKTIILAVPPVNTASSFTFSTTSPPAQTTVGSYKAISVNITNNQPETLSAIAFVSLTNSAGQTVGIFTASASSITAATSVVVYPVISGVASGTYTATIFVLSTSGVPLSPTTTLSVTL